MKMRSCLLLAVAMSLGGLLQTQAAMPNTVPASDRERLIGAWHLISLGEIGPDGKLTAVAGLIGTLIYTRDGHVTVQIMYPESAAELTNDYVRNGYEASFGSYDLDEAAHMVTHHVQGSITRGLVGKNLTRRYQLSGNQLTIRPVQEDEHWMVVWEHD
jgi:hypothetical protein